MIIPISASQEAKAPGFTNAFNKELIVLSFTQKFIIFNPLKIDRTNRTLK
jgi:hypothetical protein